MSAHATTTVKGQDKVDKLLAKLKKLEKCYVSIGVHEDAGNYTEGKNPPSVVQVSLWNEFGTETTPQRSFFRSALDENVSLINQWREEVIGNLIEKDWPIEKALETIGFRIRELIRNKIKSNIPPELGSGKSPTAEKVKDAKERKMKEGLAPVTLIESGLMMRSVEYKVVVQ